jgi:hypothetical protein
VKLIVSVSAFSLVSSLATAATAPAAAPAAATTVASSATPAATPAAAPAAAASSASTTVKMRVQLDPFYKNLNQANKNYKTPRLDSLRLMIERDLGQYSKADVELRLHELENSKKYGVDTANGKTFINTDVIKYYHLLFKVPGVDGLELGYVREIEPGLYGMTDRVKGSNVVQSVSFTGHLNRIEGYRAAYNTDWNDLKLTYHLARLGSLDDASFADLNNKKSSKEYADTTWYHKLTSDFAIDKTNVQLGLGTQGKWLGIKDQSKPKYDLFIHLLAEHKIDDVKLKAGVAHDSYAVANAEDKADKNVATTYLVAAKYDLLPKEFALIGELNFRTLKAAEKVFTDFDTTDNKAVDSASETAFTLAGQYMLDDKLSFIPSYSYYNSSTSRQWVDRSKDNVFGEGSKLLGSDNKATKYEQALALRVRYDY